MAQVIIEGTETQRAKDQARALARGHNRPLGDGVYDMQKAEFYVYMFTVGRRELKTTHALLNSVEIPACKPGQRYLRFGIPIPEPFPQRVEDVFGTGEDPYKYHRGVAGARRIAQDICDPTNPTLNQGIEDYTKIDPFFAVQNGTNYAKHGVFWSMNPEPTEEELLRAEKRRDSFYRLCITTADKLFAEDPKFAEAKMGAAGFDMKDVRIALDFYGEERPYHKKFTPMTSCPNCGQNIKQGLAYHKDEDGDLCVIDWERTVASGKRKREDVPQEKRWWKGPGRPAGSKSEESPESGE